MVRALHLEPAAGFAMSSDAPAEALRILPRPPEPSNDARALRAEVLADVGEALSESVDYALSLASLTAVLVPRVGDWCCISVLDARDVYRRVAVVHQEPARAPACREYLEAPPRPDRPERLLDAIPGEGPLLHAELGDEDLADLTSEPHEAAALRALGLRACVVAPIVARGVPLGSIVLAASDEQRRFGPTELELAGEIARRAALVIDQARLLRDAEDRHAAERTAREQAEAATRTKDEFLALLAHELRNPLSPVVTALELMKWKGDAGVARERQAIERQVAHLVRLVDDVTEVSRLARGKLETVRSVIELDGVIDQAVELATPLLQQARVQLKLDVAPGLALLGDSVRLARLVAALLSNAADHTSEGGGIGLRATREGAFISVRFVDGGMAGLGSGLSLARALAILHGGSLATRSNGKGHGSEVELRLPAAELESMVPGRQPDVVSSSMTRVARVPRRILVVDDNVDSAELVAEFLRAVGHEVAVAHDGPTALEASGVLRPQVAILDIGLPVMDGYELAERLAEQHGSATPRLIALTGYGQDHDRERSRRAGFVTHCVKPVDTRLLLNAIDEN